MRLEHDQQPPGLRAKRRQRRGDLVGIMREIVDDRDAAGLADRLQPPLQPLEAAERGRRILDPHAERARRRDRRQRVRRVVAPGNAEPHVVPLPVGLDREA